MNQKNNRRGITLIEVMLSVIILAILAVVAVTALLYPTYLVVMSSIEQSAINAGNSAIESHLNNYAAPIAQGTFYTAGWSVNTTNSISVYTENVPGSIGDQADIMAITTTVQYRDGYTIELETYRSLEIPSSER